MTDAPDPFAISIHSLVKRETGNTAQRKKAATNFNPLPRKEGDYLIEPPEFTAEISIHSLVKRETFCYIDGQQQMQISIHSLVKRETVHFSAIMIVPFSFQSTPS